MKLVVAFGKSDPAEIVGQREMTWDEYAALLSTAYETDDKASRGWSIPASFSPLRRRGDHLVYRYALTLDYDVVAPEQMRRVLSAAQPWQHFAYTTWSHSEERPRWRVVMPLDRPASFDEFQAVSRRVAETLGGIELAARESHSPPHMMYLPTVQPGARMRSQRAGGETPCVSVDAVLATYANWTDKASWPHRREHDRPVDRENESVDPRTKPGVVGAFCRAFTVEDAIAHFDLPYDRVR